MIFKIAFPFFVGRIQIFRAKIQQNLFRLSELKEKLKTEIVS